MKNTLTFSRLVETIRHAHQEMARQAGKAVNVSLTLRNWLIGYYIAEYEPSGKDRATYGDHLFTELAKALTGLSNCNRRQLYRYHRFYSFYPQIVGTVLPQSGDFPWLSSIREKVGTLSPQLQSTGSKLIASPKGNDLPVVRSVTALSQIEPQKLLNSLSYSHFEELIAIDDPTKRAFYEMESIRGNWSLGELKHQIGSLYYERSRLSHDKKKVSDLARQCAETRTALDIHSPHVFELLDLKPAKIMDESPRATVGRQITGLPTRTGPSILPRCQAKAHRRSARNISSSIPSSTTESSNVMYWRNTP